MGYGDGVKGYRIWSPSESRIVTSRDVTFDENTMYVSINKTAGNRNDNTIRDDELEIESLSTPADGGQIQVEQSPVTTSQFDDEPVGTDTGESETDHAADVGSKRPRKKPQRLIEEMEGHHVPGQNGCVEELVVYALHVADDIETPEPTTYKEAVSCAESGKWLVAMSEEMKSLHKNKTWELVRLPRGRRLIGCKWVLKRKEGTSEGDPIRYKARLVAKGFRQQKGVDYNEIFSPVVRHTSIRVLLAIVAHYDLELEQMDVKTTFLHGELEEDIYMSQPEGFIASGKETYVFHLKKSLYGLK